MYLYLDEHLMHKIFSLVQVLIVGSKVIGRPFPLEVPEAPGIWQVGKSRKMVHFLMKLSWASMRMLASSFVNAPNCLGSIFNKCMASF